MSAVVQETEVSTSVGKVIELTAESPESFEDAVRRGIEKAGETVDDIRSAWVEGQQVLVKDGRVVAYRVDLKITFIVH
jgi:flavin-binding protein dodecin